MVGAWWNAGSRRAAIQDTSVCAPVIRLLERALHAPVEGATDEAARRALRWRLRPAAYGAPQVIRAQRVDDHTPLSAGRPQKRTHNGRFS